MDAANGAHRCATLDLVILPPEIVGDILREGNAGVSALLRTPVHEPVFTDVQITAAGAAVPVIRVRVREILLKAVVVGEIEWRLAGGDNLFEDRPLPVVERFQLAAVIVDDPDRRR